MLASAHSLDGGPQTHPVALPWQLPLTNRQKPSMPDVLHSHRQSPAQGGWVVVVVVVVVVAWHAVEVTSPPGSGGVAGGSQPAQVSVQVYDWSAQ